MQVDTLPDAIEDAAVSPVARYLASENDVLRSAAIRALPAIGAGGDVRPALIAALLDPDPDVRSDAMEALATLALPEDAEVIRRSLEGDPVREVKLAAIKALVRLRDAQSVDLLRALVISRAEDRVTWEDEISDWDDWLDIQTAAIEALGLMGDAKAVPDLRRALDDAFGQTLDVPVFAALSGMGSAGIGALLDIFDKATGAAKRRAATALSKASPESFIAHLDTLLCAPEPELRRLALGAMPSGDERVSIMAKGDPDPDVRIAALERGACAWPDLARACLSDPEGRVQAAALARLKPPFSAEFHDALIDNLVLWLDHGGSGLAAQSAETLVALAPNRAEGPLLRTIEDKDRPLEVRITAARALGSSQLGVPVERIASVLENPARQIRTAMLTALGRRAAAGDAKALDVAVQAIRGDFNQSDVVPSLDTTNALDAGTPKEGAGPRKVWITPEGDIVDRESDAEPSGDNTLDAILSAPGVSKPPMAGDTPEETGAKRAKRRAVEGPDDIGASLACDAILLFADVCGDGLTEAIVSRSGDADDVIRRAAWEALAGRQVPAHFLPKAEMAFKESDPTIRMAALRILTANGVVQVLADALEDDDALIRAEAVAALPGEAALDFVADAATAVRRAAVRVIARADSVSLVKAAVDRAVLSERTDTLRALAGQCEEGKSRAVAALGAADCTDRRALVVLRAFEGLAETVRS